MDDNALPGMKKPADQVELALNMCYKGMSLNAIRKHLQKMHNNYPSDSTVYEWIDKFTKKAVKQTKNYKPEVGDVWVTNETHLKIGGQEVWLWDIIDTKTRFLLASHLSTKRTISDARVLLTEAARKAEKQPKVVITDHLAAYIDGVEFSFGADTEHLPLKSFRTGLGTQFIERFHSTLKVRTRLMHRLKSIDNAKNILQGWVVHYNYLQRHEALGDKTPAQKADIKHIFKNWTDFFGSGRSTRIDREDDYC